MFHVNALQNDMCISGANRNGTCYLGIRKPESKWKFQGFWSQVLKCFSTADECTMHGGTPSGSCASGFGVCCICKNSVLQTQNLNKHWVGSISNPWNLSSIPVQLSCGATTSQNNSFIVQVGKWMDIHLTELFEQRIFCWFFPAGHSGLIHQLHNLLLQDLQDVRGHLQDQTWFQCEGQIFGSF